MAGLRVIGGRARGRRLQMVPGDSTRPIGDRVKEALFNIIGPDIVEARFLDLFAGTGGVGIEALSRGASWAVFLDRQEAAIRTIRANLQATGLSGSAEVFRADAFSWIEHSRHQPFEYVYVAPPQYQELWSRAVLALDARPALLAQDAWVIAQIHLREFADLCLTRLVPSDRRRYGNTLLAFYAAPADEETTE